MGLLVIRGCLGQIAGAVKTVAGVDLPATAGTFSQSTGTAAIWLGPDEWVIVARSGAEAGMMTGLKNALSGIHAQVADVTDYYTTIAIGGTAARDVLARTTMIDLHPRGFSQGNAVASTFGHAGAWLQMVADEESGGVAFSLYVRRSMADYLWCLLADAGREFGLDAQNPIGQVKLHLPHFEGGG